MLPGMDLLFNKTKARACFYSSPIMNSSLGFALDIINGFF